MKNFIKKALKILLYIFLFLLLLILFIFLLNKGESALRQKANPLEISPSAVVFEDTFGSVDLTHWEKLMNKDGDTLKLAQTNYFIKDEILNLGITPVESFEQQLMKYNNSYILTQNTFSYDQYKLETRFKVDGNLTGSTGVWVNAVDEKGSIWKPGDNKGFRGAFGVSYLSQESSMSGLSGLRFILVKGWSPQCTIIVPEEIDPFVFNTYGIVWKKGQFDAYINGKYIGSCKDWTNIVSDYKIQLWTDNYLVTGWFGVIPNLFGIQFTNPNQPQYTQFDYVKVLGN